MGGFEKQQFGMSRGWNVERTGEKELLERSAVTARLRFGGDDEFCLFGCCYLNIYFFLIIFFILVTAGASWQSPGRSRTGGVEGHTHPQRVHLSPPQHQGWQKLLVMQVPEHHPLSERL